MRATMAAPRSIDGALVFTRQADKRSGHVAIVAMPASVYGSEEKERRGIKIVL